MWRFLSLQSLLRFRRSWSSLAWPAASTVAIASFRPSLPLRENCTWKIQKYTHTPQLLHFLHQRQRIYPARREDLFFSSSFRSRGVHLFLQGWKSDVYLLRLFLYSILFGVFKWWRGQLRSSSRTRTVRTLPLRYKFGCKHESRWWKPVSWDHRVPASSCTSSTTDTATSSKFQRPACLNSPPRATGINEATGISCRTSLPTSQPRCTIAQMIWTLLSDALQCLYWNIWKAPSVMCSCLIYQSTFWHIGTDYNHALHGVLVFIYDGIFSISFIWSSPLDRSSAIWRARH